MRENLKENLKHLLSGLWNLTLSLIVLGCLGTVVLIASILVTNIANVWRLTGYLDVTFGLSCMMLYLIAIWAPIWVTIYLKNSK
jgi:hypothetical protein